MDFVSAETRQKKDTPPEIYPSFIVSRTSDLMSQSGKFLAVWDEETGLWSKDEYRLQQLVDDVLWAEKEKHGEGVSVKTMRLASSGSWRSYRAFLRELPDNFHPLDTKLVYSNTVTKRGDFATKRLPYALAPGEHKAWDELAGTLYSPAERAKIEWAIGSIVAGDSVSIQKFLVFYGPAGSGKSTILGIVEKLFTGYTATFDAKALGGSNNQFSTEAFRTNPLVAIQHDGDLSRIEDNTKLNSIVSHEDMLINEKYKSPYTSRISAFLFMGTNKPVKITDAKSGLIRRLIDVHPSGDKVPTQHYQTLLSQINFELGAIAEHCLQVYRSMGKHYYDGYRPMEMILQTDIFYNFVESHQDVFKQHDGTSLNQAWALYKEFCSDSKLERIMPRHIFREELRNYFDEYHDRKRIGDEQHRSWYEGFKRSKLQPEPPPQEAYSLSLDQTESIFDTEMADRPAQFSVNRDGADIPGKPWAKVTSTLKDIDTSQVHYVKVPENHIVIDFDIKDSNGQKSPELNLRAASEWPSTYAEFSKSGGGVHLHYDYKGENIELLRPDYSEGIEIKVFSGGSSLRRKLSFCNNTPISTINDATLPKKERKMLNATSIKSEKALRDLISRNLKKEIHPGTKPSIDFIAHILKESYDAGLEFNVEDMKGRVMNFAARSTNQSMPCIKIVQNMIWKSDDTAPHASECECESCAKVTDNRRVIFDVEVFPNLFVVCWKYEGDEEVVKMINPGSSDIEGLFSMKLVGFNNRKYDNHILYAAYMGYSNEALYKLSQKIIANEKTAMFGEAYNLSHADIYDYAATKMGLKKWEIELGIHHMELDLPWDKDVAEADIPRVVEYCANDVRATEAVMNHLSADYTARAILAELSGLKINDTTAKHTAAIIFQGNRDASRDFVYTDLSKLFPGYSYDFGKSTYKGVEVGEGGYVYSEPGMYENVVELDIESMHPASIEALNLFGPYTKNYSALKSARLAIKHDDYTKAGALFDGKLKPYLADPSQAKALAYALKIVINTVYGLTSAKFDNPFRDIRNKDNIVAKRGALFMVDLKEYVESLGAQVVHIKTDSIKIPNASEELIEKIQKFGQKYGYTFANEGVFERFCLVNDAVYIARKEGLWKAVGAQFAHPYVFKTLFTKEDISWENYGETKSVSKGAMYLDLEHDRPAFLVDGMRFVGRTGCFVAVKEGGVLWRVNEDKHYAVTGTKGYLWLEEEMLRDAADRESKIDRSYYDGLRAEAVRTIEKFGNFEEFTKE